MHVVLDMDLTSLKKSLDRLNRPLKNTRPKQAIVNPYRDKLLAEPDRIFAFLEPEDDIARLATLLKGKEFILELGSGSGGHLIKQAQERPNCLFLGFELRIKRCVRTIEKAQVVGADNVSILRVDARAIELLIPKESAEAVYINFPDPWAKMHQRKHRMLDEDMPGRLSAILKAGGNVYFKTDHQEYYHWVLSLFSSSDEFEIEGQTEDLYNSAFLEQNVLTEFESLFIKQGLPIYYASFRRK